MPQHIEAILVGIKIATLWIWVYRVARCNIKRQYCWDAAADTWRWEHEGQMWIWLEWQCCWEDHGLCCNDCTCGESGLCWWLEDASHWPPYWGLPVWKGVVPPSKHEWQITLARRHGMKMKAVLQELKWQQKLPCEAMSMLCACLGPHSEWEWHGF